MTSLSLANGSRILLGVALMLGIVAAFAALYPFLQLDYLESQRAAYLEAYADHPVEIVLLYLAVTAACVGLALPVTGVSALLAGALFGFPVGLLACAGASMIGATLVFLWSRYLFREWLQSRFRKQLVPINRGIEKEGGYYVFSARLLMIFPFFMVNILCGLSALRLPVYVISTLLSQTIVVAVWVYAGSTLASLDSRSEVLSLATFVTLACIGLAPLILHRALLWWRDNTSMDS